MAYWGWCRLLLYMVVDLGQAHRVEKRTGYAGQRPLVIPPPSLKTIAFRPCSDLRGKTTHSSPLKGSSENRPKCHPQKPARSHTEIGVEKVKVDSGSRHIPHTPHGVLGLGSSTFQIW